MLTDFNHESLSLLPHQIPVEKLPSRLKAYVLKA